MADNSVIAIHNAIQNIGAWVHNDVVCIWSLLLHEFNAQKNKAWLIILRLILPANFRFQGNNLWH